MYWMNDPLDQINKYRHVKEPLVVTLVILIEYMFLTAFWVMYLFLSSLFYLIIAVDCILKFNFIFSVVVKQFRCSCYEITSIFNDFVMIPLRWHIVSDLRISKEFGSFRLKSITHNAWYWLKFVLPRFPILFHSQSGNHLVSFFIFKKIYFYHFSYLFSLRTKDNLKLHKKVCELKDFCSVVMASESTETLEFNQYRKSEATPYIIYADLEALSKKK